MNPYYVIAIWVGMALLASVVSIKIAVPAALVEIVVGALAGNIPGIQQHVTQTDLVTFLASAKAVYFLPSAQSVPTVKTRLPLRLRPLAAPKFASLCRTSIRRTALREAA